MGPQPSHSTLCESIQQHAVPYVISHGCAGAAPTTRQSCLPVSSPTCVSVMLQMQTCKTDCDGATAEHRPPRHIQRSPLPFCSASAPQLWHPDVLAGNPARLVWCSLFQQNVTPPVRLNQPYSLLCAAPSSVLTSFWKDEVTDFTCGFRLLFGFFSCPLK